MKNSMPERPDMIEYTEKSQRNYVQKQKSLMLLQDSELPLSALKILDLYLSKLDNYLSKQLTPDGKTEKISSQKLITIGNGDFEKALGLTHINKNTMKTRLKELSQPIEVSEKDNEDELDLVWLFENIHAERGDNRTWTVTFQMTDKAEKYIFIPENIHYLRYRLLNVVNLSSRYAYFLYMYLEDQRFMHTDWRVELEELKELLGCSDQPTYQEYRFFNSKVLLASQKELAERTDCKFTYKPIRRGRGGRVVGVEFHLEPKKESKYKKAMEQITIEDMMDDDEPIDISSSILTEDESRTVAIIRLKIDNPLIEMLSDSTIAACYRELDHKYGQYSGDYQKPLDYDIQQFVLILDKVRQEIENKRLNGEPEIKNINSYVRQATLNFWKEGH
ncbi:MAG: replication initiation protein [Lachnospiraceae bacterium]|nr:replication initiation protein [Lachnospiraceae bacterium]MBR6383506.1 replication initiation protein [Lachnospiraceae bacterium]